MERKRTIWDYPVLLGFALFLAGVVVLLGLGGWALGLDDGTAVVLGGGVWMLVMGLLLLSAGNAHEQKDQGQ